jgi:2Fe-2S ferredoxin
VKVKFIPQNIVCEVKSGQSVLDVATENNIFIKSICRGVPSCAECRVILAEGEYNVLQPSSAELALIGSGYFIDRRRLSCQLKCFGDITVDLTEQVEKEKELKNPKPRSRNSREETIQSNAVMGNMMAPPNPANKEKKK